MGFDTFNVGPELEYFLFKDSKGTEPLDEGGYFVQTTRDAATELRAETTRALEGMGIGIEYSHHEVGPSQHEIDMRYTNAMAMADATITYRLIVKEIAAKNGVYATFMPKPIFGENGSGMHIHQSLFRGERNAFFDGDRQVPPLEGGEGLHRRPAQARARALGDLRPVGQLLQAARSGLRGAGLRRLVAAQPLGADPHPLLQARIRGRDEGGDSLPRPGLQPLPRLRLPAARGSRGDRAQLPAAGADGDQPLPPLAKEREERGIVSLPETLGEAIEELSHSRLMQKALGGHIFDNYVELKRKEWDDYRVQLTNWEFERYLPVL